MNITNILTDIKNGIPILIVDDYDRENDADLMIAGEKATSGMTMERGFADCVGP